MDERQVKRRKLLINAAAYIAASMVVLYVRSRIRNRREPITYGPLVERDAARISYINDKILRDDTTCTNMIRLKRASFFQLCQVLRERQLLCDTIHVSVEEQVAMFLHTIGHNERNRVVATNFGRSSETVSRYFRIVLNAIGELRNDLIQPPSLETPTKIAGNPRWDPYFKDCIGAIDGTHIRASVSKSMELAFRGRKSFATQNVMAAVDFDMKFTYVLAGWEGTAHDAVVLADALERENGGLRVPEGKFYLVDAGYGSKPGFMPPFRGVRYHLNEWGNNPVQNEKELFNLRHSSLRVTVERAFGSLNRRFKVLDDATPFFPYLTQVDIVIEMDAAGGHIQWTNAMSTFVLTYLSDLVRNGNRTNFVCKQVHLNGCAKALNGSLGCQVSGTQVSNHLRKWKKPYKKMKRLHNISAALWDEDTCTITLDAGHYQEYIKDHKDDANFLNKPLEHYREMETIFNNAMATGKYAKGSSETLGTDFTDLEKVEASNGAANEQGCASKAPTESCNNGEATMSSNIGGQSSASKAPTARRARIGADGGGPSSTSQPQTRRARISGDDDLGVLLIGLEKLSDAIVQTAATSVDSELPKDLYDNLMAVPGFEEAYLVHFYAYLCDHPSVARAFNRLSLSFNSTFQVFS